MTTLLACAGCGFVRGYHGNASGERVAVVGDSITFVSAREIDAALMPNYSIILDFGVGLRIGQMYPRLLAEVAQDPDAVVINLGTNDAIQNWPTMLTDFETQWRAVRLRPCVVLVTVTDEIEAITHNGATAQLNAAIRAKRSQPNVVLVDWAIVVALYVAENRRTDILIDGIHPTQHGQDVLAALYRDALGRCPSA